MEKRLFHKLMSGLIISAFVLFLLVPAEKIFAEYVEYGTVKYAKKLVLINGGYIDAPNRPYFLEMGSKTKNAKKVTVNIENKGIVYGDATKNSYTGEYQIQLYVHGTGTTKLTIKVNKSGRVKTYKATIKTVDYQNPVKELKIGNKNYASKFKKTKQYNKVKFPSKKGKLVVKPAKNWKVKQIEVYGDTKDGYTEVKVDNVKTYNLSKFVFVKDAYVTLVNTKTKAVERLELLKN